MDAERLAVVPRLSQIAAAAVSRSLTDADYRIECPTCRHLRTLAEADAVFELALAWYRCPEDRTVLVRIVRMSDQEFDVTYAAMPRISAAASTRA